MKLSRRQFLDLAAGAAAGAAALPVTLRFARAQSYPTRPVRILEGFGAGAATDIIARLMGQWLSERLGQPFMVENRSGANGNIAAEAAARAAPDGYTLLLAVTSNVINASTYEKLNFSFTRDFAPIASISRVPLVMALHPSVPAKTLPELLEYAKANPGKINMGSTGTGNITHVAGELFMMLTGINLFLVPYRGAQMSTAVISGQVQVVFAPLTSYIELIKAGALRAVAVTTAARARALPDVPTVADVVPGYEVSGWYGVVAPRNTPANVVDMLNNAVKAGLADSKITTQLASMGNAVDASSPADFAKFIADETEKWGKVVRFAGIKVE